MSRRKTTEEEKTLFQTTIDTPRPLKAATPKPKEPLNKMEFVSSVVLTVDFADTSFQNSD